MTPDVNILVAAFRGDHPHHKVARSWLEQVVSAAGQGSPLTLQPMVIVSFLRLVTHSKIFVNPTPIAEALRFVEALLQAPGIELATLGGEMSELAQLCLEKSLSANDIPDAWLAAAAIHQGEHVVSFDADFRRLLPKDQFTRLAA
jgi:uncharacterized protein